MSAESFPEVNFLSLVAIYHAPCYSRCTTWFHSTVIQSNFTDYSTAHAGSLPGQTETWQLLDHFESIYWSIY